MFYMNFPKAEVYSFTEGDRFIEKTPEFYNILRDEVNISHSILSSIKKYNKIIRRKFYGELIKSVSGSKKKKHSPIFSSLY